MNILSIETSSTACSAALLTDNDCLEIFKVEPRGHSQLILTMIEQLLSECEISVNQLSAIAFARGPGSFTGLRIGAGVVQGIAYAADLPVIPVSTLATLSQAGYEEHQHRYWATAIDARMKEVYWGVYKVNDLGYVESMSDEVVSLPQLVDLNASFDFSGIGDGWAEYPQLNDRFKLDCVISDVLPRAKYVASLASHSFKQGLMKTAFDAVPVYLRNNVVHQK
ncbi:MAG: tRNA (adenosine(37)-N6)-threonylcarbamoyltransferase complex dimerization subunit type 1 TsaB [Methylococcales bacterium]|nr:tRNA (adenosine(37)-N6)-threonylcarbamoyltransferase complex dimerization subunit type 1 TsaB [Methylococcales bacterium]MBT7410164.1 tRNA (adenosine(37)-N6)-threonylcarbamoyltransferase complex dimerization subunit type 1 TsaB [Methylococcales bacterium]